MNNLRLKAMRQSLGLTVAEACEITPNPKTGEPPSKRYFQYLEAGERKIHDDVKINFFTLSSFYTLLLDKLLSDIEKFNEQNPKLVLPFFKDFADFEKTTNTPSVAYWKIWQAVVGHLVLIGKINYLDDTAKIPDDFESLKIIKGCYDHK